LYIKTIDKVNIGVLTMKISTKGRYGTRALLDLALHKESEPILLKDIAGRQDISLRYLEQIIPPLVAGGLIRSIRGARGGIELVKEPSEVKLSDIIQILEGSVAPVACIINPSICERSISCVTRDVWNELKEAIDNVLQSTTLQDLVERHKIKRQAKEPMYFI